MPFWKDYPRGCATGESMTRREALALSSPRSGEVFPSMPGETCTLSTTALHRAREAGSDVSMPARGRLVQICNWLLRSAAVRSSRVVVLALMVLGGVDGEAAELPTLSAPKNAVKCQSVL